jgi:pre-rRNA-processing protein TSR3
MSLQFPPTIVVRNPRENPKKCSVLPLKGRSDLIFLNYPVTRPLELAGYIRLATEGEQLSAKDADKGLLILDGSWRWAEVMNRDFAQVSPRSLQGFLTAYPRKSKLGTDPEQGLATAEALFLAYHLMGRPTAGLLDHYRWAEEFLQLNQLTER